MRRTHRRAKPVVRGARQSRPGAKLPKQSGVVRRKNSSASTAYFASFQRLVGEVFRMNGRLLDVAAALAHDLHVTPTHWQIIAIVRNRPLTIPAISRRVGLRRQSVQHNIKQLVARGLIEQATNPDHRRASLIRLSEKGRQLMEVLLVRQKDLTAVFAAGLELGVADIDAITDTLRRMREQSEGQPLGLHSEDA